MPFITISVFTPIPAHDPALRQVAKNLARGKLPDITVRVSETVPIGQGITYDVFHDAGAGMPEHWQPYFTDDMPENRPVGEVWR